MTNNLFCNSFFLKNILRVSLHPSANIELLGVPVSRLHKPKSWLLNSRCVDNLSLKNPKCIVDLNYSPILLTLNCCGTCHFITHIY